MTFIFTLIGVFISVMFAFLGTFFLFDMIIKDSMKAAIATLSLFFLAFSILIMNTFV